MDRSWKRVERPLRVGNELQAHVEENNYLMDLFISKGRVERDLQMDWWSICNGPSAVLICWGEQRALCESDVDLPMIDAGLYSQ